MQNKAEHPVERDRWVVGELPFCFRHLPAPSNAPYGLPDRLSFVLEEDDGAGCLVRQSFDPRVAAVLDDLIELFRVASTAPATTVCRRRASPWASGPRWAIALPMAWARASSSSLRPALPQNPAIPHISRLRHFLQGRRERAREAPRGVVFFHLLSINIALIRGGIG